MDEENTETNAEIQAEKYYIQTKSWNDERKNLCDIGLKVFENDERRDADYQGREKYAGPVKKYGYLVLFCQRLEKVCVAHRKVYHTDKLESLPASLLV